MNHNKLKRLPAGLVGGLLASAILYNPPASSQAAGGIDVN